MPFSLSGKKRWMLLLIVLTGSSFIFLSNRSKINYTTQVKPIINKNCITCHGGVKQKGGFSLLFREEALAKTETGKYGIVPGDVGNSEMIRRINLKDPEERMPYKHDPLSDDDIEVLTRWVKEGARWGEHWAYETVEKVEVPQPSKWFGIFKQKSDWAKNDVDHFVANKLHEQDLSPSPMADKQILLRRVSLDIIGMPAPENLAIKFLNDPGANAYNQLVDSLLALSAYGEKWTSMWLDLARYADTKGYERDDSRNIWKYRDWLIKAFNRDMPYDSFLIDQIGGDLLPNATDEDFIATAFHRNSMTNDEGGTDNEEFRTAAVMDRVNTTWQATMGTTFGCVQCHSHPYDPFKHEDYYKFMAFFNNTRDEDTYADYPLLRAYNDSMQQVFNDVIAWVSQNASKQKTNEISTFLKTWQPAYNSLTCDNFTNSELSDTKWLAFRNNAISRLPKVELQYRNEVIFRYKAGTEGGIWKIHLDSSGGTVIATIPLAQTKNGWTIAKAPLGKSIGIHDVYFTYSNSQLKKPTDNGAVFDWFYFNERFPGKGKPGYETKQQQYWWLLTANVPTTPVMMDNPLYMQRASHVFERGNWLVKGDEVQPDVPASLNAFPAKAPRNRLGLSMWLTSKQNPLTARTMVNRVWEQLFGNGLAETLEDFGSQGIPPTHVKLLNWMSYTFMNDYNWSTKKLIRLIVTSATYQQDSKILPQHLQKDPYNKWYARAPRVRLSAEQLRDQALCISGLISKKMYGPSVYPYQPPGIWQTPYNGSKWVQSEGEDQHRRALYTYWKRSASYPSMITFDGVSRELCTVRRIRTNTPLQALTSLNDPANIDIARHLANRMQKLWPKNVTQQIGTGFALATNHAVDEKSLQALENLYATAISIFKKDAGKASEINGGVTTNKNAETAALTVVANAILNLDEVVVRN